MRTCPCGTAHEPLERKGREKASAAHNVRLERIGQRCPRGETYTLRCLRALPFFSLRICKKGQHDKLNKNCKSQPIKSCKSVCALGLTTKKRSLEEKKTPKKSTSSQKKPQASRQNTPPGRTTTTHLYLRVVKVLARNWNVLLCNELLPEGKNQPFAPIERPNWPSGSSQARHTSRHMWMRSIAVVSLY